MSGSEARRISCIKRSVIFVPFSNCIPVLTYVPQIVDILTAENQSRGDCQHYYRDVWVSFFRSFFDLDDNLKCRIKMKRFELAAV